MRKFAKDFSYGLIIGTIIALAGCATFNALITKQELTPPARYYDALKTFNSNVETYLQVYDLSNAETKTRWKASIDPVIKTADSALKSWKAQLNSPDALSKEEAWKEARKQMINMLITSGIIKIQE